MIYIDLDNTYSIEIELYHNDFVSRWLRLFEKTIKTSSINQLEAFAENIPDKEARLRLEQSVKTINQWIGKKIIPWPDGDVNWNDQEWFNSLHTCFERISGSWDQPTKLFVLAPPEIKSCIRDLNFYIHHLESRAIDCKKWFYISFNKDTYSRQKFEESDYQLFTHFIQGGEVYIHYAELGKNYIDLYKDNLPVDYQGLKNLHYYSAEIGINLSKTCWSLYPKGFDQWAQKNSIDLSNKKIGLGSIVVGHVKNVDVAYQAFKTSSKIINIRIDHGRKTI